MGPTRYSGLQSVQSLTIPFTKELVTIGPYDPVRAIKRACIRLQTNMRLFNDAVQFTRQ